MFYKDKEKDSNICVGTTPILLAIRKTEKDLKFGGWQNRVVSAVTDKYCLFFSMQEERLNNTVCTSHPLKQRLLISQETPQLTVVIYYKFSKYFQQCKLAR